jgi:hypothetical protein
MCIFISSFKCFRVCFGLGITVFVIN